MSGFDGFNQAATLYAENLPVIDAMKAAMDENITEYLNALSTVVREKAGELVVHSHDSRGWRYFGIADQACWVSFDRRRAQIIAPGVIKCYVAGPLKRSNQDVDEMLRLLSIAEVTADGWRKELTDWCILSTTLDYGRGDPIERPSMVIARMLRHIAAAFAIGSAS